MNERKEAAMTEGVYCIPSPDGSGVICAEPCVFVILGATGDLATRKLFPAIYEIARQGLVPSPVFIIGAAGSNLTHEQFRDRTVASVKKYARIPPKSDEELSHFVNNAYYQAVKFDDRESFARLKDLVAKLEKEESLPKNKVYYLAIPPSFYPLVIDHLHGLGLSERRANGWPRVVIEKPFGRDLASALDLNRRALHAFDEKQIYRIDHYLGKETVQNIMVLRFANGNFEPTWNRRYIDHVQITVAEEEGIGSRGRYYEEAGVLRDMLQNHLLQLLTMTAMEPPTSFEAEAIRDERLKVLRSIKPMAPAEVANRVVRAQYESGNQNGGKVKAYREEEYVASDSMTETFLAVKLFVENWRWAGVPFYLRSGKRMAARTSEIAIQYREVPHMMFRSLVTERLQPSSLVLRIQPNEGVCLNFSTKRPGMILDINTQAMDFNYYEAYGDKAPDAYERLLLDVVIGDATLFPRTDAVVESWEFVASIVNGWKQQRRTAIPAYEPGSWGPDEAVEMMAAEKRKWRRPE